MVDRRDVELLVRAKDLTSKPLRDVSDAINNVSTSLQKQIEAARRGDVSFQELAATLREVQDAGRALAQQQGLIDRFNKLTQSSEKLQTSLTAAAAAVEAQRAKMAASETTTKAQERELAKLERAYAKVEASVNRNAAAVQTAREELDRAGIETGNLAAAQQQIVASATAAGQAATTLSTAMQGYARNLRETQAAARAAAEAEKQATAVREQAAKASQQAAAAEERKARVIAETNAGLADFLAAEAAKRTAADQKAAAEAAKAEERKARAIAQTNAELANQIEADAAKRTAAEQKAAAEAAKAEEEKARIIARVNASLNDTLQRQAEERLALEQRTAAAIANAQATAAGSGRNASASRSDVAGTLRSIADPAGDARRTLAGLESQVRDVASSIGELNGPVRNYEQSVLALAAAQRAAMNVAGLIDRFRDQTDAVRQARQQFVAARDDVRRYAEAIRNTAEPTELQRRQLADAERRLAAAANEYRRYATAARETQASLRDAGVNTRALTEAQTRLTAVVRQTTQETERLNAAFNEFGSAGRGGAGIFGLSPYAVQNLGFQINDFFTQIASGTSVMQALAQQGGQVVQVFGPGAWTALARWVPLIAAIGAVALTTAAALSRLNDTISSTRNFSANLTLLNAGPGSGVSGAQLTQIARDVERLGFAFDEARTAALLFLREGISPANIGEATEAAARLSRVLGIDLADAARLVNRALVDGQSGFLALQEAGVRFTDAERQRIEAANASADAYDRQQAVLAALTARLRQADEEGMGQWRRGLIAARNLWRDFLDVLGDTVVIQGLRAGLNLLAVGLENLATIGPRVGRVLVNGLVPFAGLLDTIRDLLQQIGVVPAGTPTTSSPPATSTPAPAAPTPTGQDPVGGPTLDTQRALRDLRRRELELIRSDRRRSRTERIDAQRRLLIGDPASGFTGEIQEQFPNADRLTQIQQLNQRLLEFRRQLDEEQSSTAAELRRDFQAIQQDLQNTIRIRDEAIRGIQDDVAAGAMSPAQAIERIQEAAEAARPQLRALAEEARRFRDANRGGDALRNAALDALVAQAERQANAPGSRQGITATLSAQQAEVQRLISERQQFVQTQAALEQQGQVSRSESEDRIRQFYADTNAELERQIQLLQEAAEAARATGQITPAAFAQITASVQRFRAELQRIDPQLAQLRNSIENAFAQAAVTAFNTVAESFAEVLRGVANLADLFRAAGRAAMQFFADFLRMVAQAIIQQQALAVAKMITASSGLFHSGGVVGSARGRSRDVPTSWFAAAPRYHTGGVVGLRPNEVPAILERGEEVLTRSDPRNVLNGGMSGGRGNAGGGGEVAIRNVLVTDPNMLADAMVGAAGERVVMQVLSKNRATLRQIVGG